MASKLAPCANVGEQSSCTKASSSACKGCLLVQYCSKQCQKEHWASHKKWCRSRLMETTWTPRWVLENRAPTFTGNGSREPFGGARFIWGTIPARDFVRLEINEGLEYDKDLHLLFAASGDLRNVVKTITSLPTAFSHGVHVVVNDGQFDIVVRNAIILLIAFLVEDPTEAADAIIHVWYSSFIKPCHMEILQRRVLPLIQCVCDRLSGISADTSLLNLWQFGQSSMRLVLPKANWMLLHHYFSVPSDLDTDKARTIRKNVTLAPGRIDQRERLWTTMTPAHRVADKMFRTDGLLLPFGANRVEFTVPNPTIYQQADVWSLKDSDPLHGWLSEDLSRSYPRSASADKYGKMYCFLEGLLKEFHTRLRTTSVAFELFCQPAQKLERHLHQGRFSRIEVSNISDQGYLGCHGVLTCLGPLLQPHSVNPHATLIMLFLNAVSETITEDERFNAILATFKTKMNYLRMPNCVPDKHDPRMVLLRCVGNMFLNGNKYFNRYIEACKMKQSGQLVGMEMKSKHSIIRKWPLALRLKYGQPGAQEEFDDHLESGHQGTERYVEWRAQSEVQLV